MNSKNLKGVNHNMENRIIKIDKLMISECA